MWLIRCSGIRVYADNSPVTKSDPSGLKPLADGGYEYKRGMQNGKPGWVLHEKTKTKAGSSSSGVHDYSWETYWRPKLSFWVGLADGVADGVAALGGGGLADAE